jgi:hypothetical protein
MKLIFRLSNWLNQKSTAVIILLVLTYILGSQGDKHYKYTSYSKHKHEVDANITSDGGGYYAYLPQYFIYKTKHFEFAHFIQKKYPKGKFFQGISPKNSKEFQDKYFIGTAICISPFFWFNHQIIKIFGGEVDGYSIGYQFSIFTAALAFWLLGAFSLLRLLQKFQISRSAILIGIIGLTFGTNLNYYIIYDPAFSHVYTFGLVAFFLLKLKLYAENQSKKDLVWMFFLLGLITIIRPTNLLIVLFIPFFFKSLNEFWERIKNIFSAQKAALLIAFLIFGFLIFLQFWNIHSQHGVWQFNAYNTEGFDFLSNPKIPEVLFGFRKGLFIYSPFLLLIFPALWFLYRSNRFAFICFLLFICIYIYVLSSWWCWYYGGSMGMRAMIDVFPILIIPIIFMFQKLNRFFKLLLIVFTFFMIQYNLILNFQLVRSILHYSEMNKVRFEQIFLQKGSRFEWAFHNTQPDFEIKEFKKIASFNFSPTKKVWLLDSKSSYNKEFYGTLPSLILHNYSKTKDSRIAIKLTYLQKISTEKSVPKDLLFGYRSKKRENLCVDYIGTRVASLNEFYPIEARLTSTFKYADFDSLEVMVENNDGIVKNPVCKIFSFKK